MSAKRPTSFHVMVKPRGPICNLDCAYCYYLSKERFYPDSDFLMSEEVLDAFTRQYIEAQDIPEVTFGWQGGEPTLMSPDFFRLAVDFQKKYRSPGMRIHNALQTNGANLNEEWCQLFKEFDFLIGVSLDGPRELHDTFRLDKAGNPTFDRVMAGISLLKQHQVEFNILTSVHATNVNHPIEVYRFLRDEVGARFVQFIPIVERDNDSGFQEGGEITKRSVTGRQYGDFLSAIFNEWVLEDVGRVFVQIFDVSLAAWYGHKPGLCIFEQTCGKALVVEHSGDVYACDHFVEPKYKLGNLKKTPLSELAVSVPQKAFGLAKEETLPDFCRGCEVRFICNGGCPKNRVLHTPNGEPGLNYLCEGYKNFFTHINRPMRIMTTELRAGRPPANVMLIMKGEKREVQFVGKT